jgi:hypothetical protein
VVVTSRGVEFVVILTLSVVEWGRIPVSLIASLHLQENRDKRQQTTID